MTLARGLVLLMGLCWGCLSPPRYVIVTVEDPDGIATGASAITFGRELGDMVRAPLDGRTFPVSFAKTAEEDDVYLLWVEAVDDEGTKLGRGRVELTFELGRRGTAKVALAPVCDASAPSGQWCAQADGSGNDGVCLDGECSDSVCGDGFVDSSQGEECDDGNLVDEDHCLASCLRNVCGDAILNPLAEECDDGNSTITDECSNTCRAAYCGDGVTQPSRGETCDDSNAVDGDGCDGNCTVSGCGNGVQVPPEECDDGNLVESDPAAGDFCDGNCTTPRCGNSRATGSEACDDGNAVDGDGCDSDCSLSACGNGITGGTEVCDDGNTEDGDGCDSNCTPTGCGNGVQTAGEACDDGNGSNVDGCLVGCVAASCGDGLVWAGVEGCDDGDQSATDACPDGPEGTCQPATCGDGLVWAGVEGCDDGNQTADGNGCAATCQRIDQCGNGTVEDLFEQCDDGDVVNGDGCDSNCTPTGCGNGVVTVAEQCDDGNIEDGDGCDSNCTYTLCGNGVMTTGEDCDDWGDSATCDFDCTFAECDDGYVNTAANEVCDDGAANSDGWASEPHCDASCGGTGPYCGDLTVTAPEACDEGEQTATCEPDCQAPVCGDGRFNPWAGEYCDPTAEPTLCEPDCRVRTDVATGQGHSCFLVGEGGVKCWGYHAATWAGLGDEEYLGDEWGEVGDAVPFLDLGTGWYAIAIAAGAEHTCAMNNHRRIKCWGMNTNGQLGFAGGYGMGDDLPEVYVGTDVTVIEVNPGGHYTCALVSDSSVRCWGDNQHGQLGLGDIADRSGLLDDNQRVPLGTGRTAVDISAGWAHVCALLDDDTVKCWGANPSGQLGVGDQEYRGDNPNEMGDALPVADVGSGLPVEIGVGVNFTCVRFADGRVKCWGDNDYGQLGLGDTEPRGDEPGEMGDDLPEVDLGTGRTAQTLVIGWYHACAILDTGDMKCWGTGAALGLGDVETRGDELGEMGDALPTVDLGTGRTAVRARAAHQTCARLDNGDFKCWGPGHNGQLAQGDGSARGTGPGEMGDALLPIVIGGCGDGFVGMSESCDDGFQDACGSCNADCTGVGSGSVCGDGAVCPEAEECDDAGETPVCDVDCTFAECGDGLHNVTAGETCDDGFRDACGSCDADCAGSGVGSLCGDGVVCPETEACDHSGETYRCTATCQVKPLIAAGGAHACYLASSGAVKCWGRNFHGQLGLDDRYDRGGAPAEMGNELPPVDLGAGRRAFAIAAGTNHTCVILDGGDVKCWGDNWGGQLGLGDNECHGDGNAPNGARSKEMGDNLPVVSLPQPAVAIAASKGGHTCAVLSDGSLNCWGDGSYGKLGSGDQTDRRTPGTAVDLGSGRTAMAVATGGNHTCALLDDATVKCWGGNFYGALGLGDTVHRGDNGGEMGDALPTVNLGVGRSAVAVAAWDRFSCAILDNGDLKCWGSNSFGQLGIGDTGDRGDEPGEMGDNLPSVDLGSGQTALAVAPGSYWAAHTCALLVDQSVKCWGYNFAGQLGVGDTSTRGFQATQMGDNLAAVDVGSGRTVAALDCGGDQSIGFSCAVLDDASLKCWGSNGEGQLGQGDTENRGDQPGELGDNLAPVSLGAMP